MGQLPSQHWQQSHFRFEFQANGCNDYTSKYACHPIITCRCRRRQCAKRNTCNCIRYCFCYTKRYKFNSYTSNKYAGYSSK